MTPIAKMRWAGLTKLTIEIRAKPGKFRELYQTFQALLPAIRTGRGCRACQVYRDVEDGEAFFLSVQWEARAHLEEYWRSDSAGALLGAVDLLSETARVKIGHDEPWQGIETLQKLRKRP